MLLMTTKNSSFLDKHPIIGIITFLVPVITSPTALSFYAKCFSVFNDSTKVNTHNTDDEIRKLKTKMFKLNLMLNDVK